MDEAVVIGVDTGGTFTDVVFYHRGRWHILKVPSTPERPHEAVIRGIKESGRTPLKVIHGSTVATNTLIERKGARVALITNRGLEDVIEIGRQNRERLYDLSYRRQPPLVPANLRFGVNCRIDRNGNVVEDLDESEIRKLIAELEGEEFDVVSVSFLFSFLNDEHEKRVKKAVEGFFGVDVHCSSDILPEFREFERTSTVVVNSYVAPKMKSYLGRLSQAFGEARLKVMQSNGGIISVKKAVKEPVRTILSGPAGGVTAALYIGEAIGDTKLITLDMGGTSTDVSLIDGSPLMSTELKVTGLPIKVPMIEIHTIGAGGGSIARVDEGGVLKVGPESAGADPGPVCYGRGEALTVTDANLFLGRLLPHYFLGGAMRLYPERVEPYMVRLADELGMDPYQTAEGIITVANSSMEKAIRAVSVEKGYDPEEFSLFVFGGAASLHAAALSEAMKIKRVIIPLNPGVLSAVGMVVADCVKDYTLTVMLGEDELDRLDGFFSEMEKKALEEMREEGFEDARIFVERYVDVRYAGQSYELSIPYGSDVRNRFAKAHEELYGYSMDKEIEVVNLRVRAVGLVDKPPLSPIPEGGQSPPSDAFLGKGRLYFSGSWYDADVYKREALLAGNSISGPSIVVEYSSTVFVPPGFAVAVDGFGNLIMERG
ncbi:MAG: hydantoinase/oxoprolinase family protein [Deferribacteres bacterium]|nr:hydantoinase/oxoprolinase family protein [Deferribacteres bacterium]